MESPVCLFGSRIAIHGFHKADGKFWSVRPVVPRIPDVRFRRFGSDALQISFEVGVDGHGNFKIAGKYFENSRHIRGALNVGVARSEERRVGKECRSRWSPYH